MKRRLFVLLILFSAALYPCFADAAVTVELKLDRSEMTLADASRLVLTISGARGADSQPVVHGLEAFDAEQRGTSSRLEVINGKVNSGVDYTYYIQPKRTGVFEIGPAEVKVEGKIFRSNALTVKVVEARQSKSGDRGPLFLTAHLSSDKVYLEEPVVYTLRLYYRVKISDVSVDLPESEHLSFKQIGKPSEYQSVYNGEDYQVLEVRYALRPTKEGDYDIGPSRMHLTVYELSRRRTPFNDPFFKSPFFNDPFFSASSGRPKTLLSEPLKLDVLPLPGAGRPADFSGLVGQFQVKSSLDPTTVKVGDSATLTVVLSGKGNVNRIPDLKLPEIGNVKIYGDQPVLKLSPDDGDSSGSKTMKWAIVPEKAGEYVIPSLSVSYFDTANRQYRVIKTSPATLSALPGEKTAPLQASVGPPPPPGSKVAPKRKVEELGRDILPIHASAAEALKRSSIGALFLWLMLGIPALVYAAFFCGLRLRRSAFRNSNERRAKNASKALLRRCRGQLSAEELIRSVKEYLNERMSLSLGTLTSEEAARILSANSVGADTAEGFREILLELEDRVYTGRGGDPCGMEGEVVRLVKKVEREIR